MTQYKESQRLMREANKLRETLRKLEESDSEITQIDSPAHEVAKSTLREQLQQLGRQIKRLCDYTLF